MCRSAPTAARTSDGRSRCAQSTGEKGEALACTLLTDTKGEIALTEAASCPRGRLRTPMRAAITRYATKVICSRSCSPLEPRASRRPRKRRF